MLEEDFRDVEVGVADCPVEGRHAEGVAAHYIHAVCNEQACDVSTPVGSSERQRCLPLMRPVRVHPTAEQLANPFYISSSGSMPEGDTFAHCEGGGFDDEAGRRRRWRRWRRGGGIERKVYKMNLSLSCLVTLSYSLSHSISCAGFYKFVVRDDVISPAGVRNFGTYDDVVEMVGNGVKKRGGLFCILVVVVYFLFCP